MANIVTLRKHKLMESPEFVFILIWLSAIISYQIFFTVVSINVLLYILIFFYFFLLGSIGGSQLKVAVKLPVSRSPVALAYFCSVLLLVTLIYCGLVFLHLMGSSSIAIGIVDIRQSSINGDPVIGFASLFTNSIQFLFGLSIYGYILVTVNTYCNSNHKSSLKNLIFEKSNLLFKVCICASLFASLLDGSRSFFINAFLILLFILLKFNAIKYKHLILIIIILSIVFSLSFSFFRPEVNDSLDGFKYLMVYFSGGIGALDYVVNQQAVVYWQDLESIANKLGAIGLPVGGYDLQSLRMESVELGNDFNTNVYTALGVYYRYMEYWSVFFAIFIGYIYRYSSWLSRKSPLGLLGLAFFMAALALSVFHDYVLANGYYLLKIIFILSIIRFFEFLFKNINFGLNLTGGRKCVV